MRILNIIALTLLIIGGLNWGMVGLFQLDLVATLFGTATLLSNIIYILVGIAALYSIYLFKPVSADTTHTHGTPTYGTRA